MAITIFTDEVFNPALYSGTTLTSGGAYFSTNSLNGEVQLLSAGTFNGGPVAGILYNQVDWAIGGTYLSVATAPATATIKFYNNGVATSDNTTTLVTTVSGNSPIPFAVLAYNADASVVSAFVSGTTTYSLDLSSSNNWASSKNDRRLWNLGYNT